MSMSDEGVFRILYAEGRPLERLERSADGKIAGDDGDLPADVKALFDQSGVLSGGVARRGLYQLTKSSYDALVGEIEHKRWSAFKMGDQIVLFCTAGEPVKQIAGPPVEKE